MKPKVIGVAIASCILVLAGAAILSLAWSHQTGNDIEFSPAIRMATAPSLGAAASFSVLAALSMSAAGPGTTVSGDLGLSPGLEISRTGPWTVGGTQYFGPLSLAATAQADALSAFNNMAVLPSSGVWGGAVSLGPGVWTEASDTTFTGTLTLSGASGDIWVFQIGRDMTFTGSVIMAGNAQPCNVFWQIGRDVTIALNSTFVGTLIASRDVTLVSGATVNGRIISLNSSLTTDGNTISGCAAPAPTPTPTGPTPTPTATATPSACDEAVLSLSTQVVSPGQELKFFGCIPAFGGQAVDVYLVLMSPTGVVFSAISPDGIAPGIHPYARGIINPATCKCRDLLTHVVCANVQTGVWTVVMAVLPAGAAPKEGNAIAIATTTVVVKG